MNLKKICRNIMNNIDVRENIPLYVKEIMSAYNKYSLIMLSMNYYTYFEMLSAGKACDDGRIGEITDSVNAVIKELIVDNEFKDDTVSRIDEIRKNIIKNTEILTAYTDVFCVYEHALNRVEHNFSEYELPDNYDDEKFCRSIMQYIFDTDDNTVINLKISEIMEQLPIRLTKSKFYNLIENAFSVYNGASSEGLSNLLYTLRSCSMLYKPDGFDDGFSDLKEILDGFGGVDFEAITQDIYKDTRDRLYYVTEYIQKTLDRYMMLEELVNELYTIALTYDYAEYDRETDACSMIITSVNTDFDEDKDEATDVNELFIFLEGSQERLNEVIMATDIIKDITDKYADVVSELGLGSRFTHLSMIERLNSDSVFAELDEKAASDTADEAHITSAFEKLKEEYGNLFKENGKHINRAVMSMAVSALPVFFNNISELQDYIYNMLTGCRDAAEKKACYEIISEIIGE